MKVVIRSKDEDLANKFMRFLESILDASTEFEISSNKKDADTILDTYLYQEFSKWNDINKIDNYDYLIANLINIINSSDFKELIIPIPSFELNKDSVVRSKIFYDVKMNTRRINKVRIDNGNAGTSSEINTTQFYFDNKYVSIITIDADRL